MGAFTSSKKWSFLLPLCLPLLLGAAGCDSDDEGEGEDEDESAATMRVDLEINMEPTAAELVCEEPAGEAEEEASDEAAVDEAPAAPRADHAGEITA